MVYQFGDMLYFTNEIAKQSTQAQQLGLKYKDCIKNDHDELLKCMELGEPIRELCKCIGPSIVERIQQLTRILNSQEAEDQDVAILLDLYQMYLNQWKTAYSS